MRGDGVRLPHCMHGLDVMRLVSHAPAAAAEAKPVWELTPYRVEVLTAFAPRPELTPAWQADFQARLAVRLAALHGAAWSVRVAAAPAGGMLSQCAALSEHGTADACLRAAAPRENGPPAEVPADCDKVMLLAVSWADGYRVTAREFDVRTQQWSPPVSRSAPQLTKLVDGATTAVCQAFAPLARVSALDGQRAVLRLRTSALVPRDRQPRPVARGDAFRLVVRSDAERGLPTLLTIPRTICVVEEVRDDGLRCRLESGVRGPLDVYLNGNAEWLALGVGPLPPSVTPAKASAVTSDALEAAARQALEKKYRP